MKYFEGQFGMNNYDWGSKRKKKRKLSLLTPQGLCNL